MGAKSSVHILSRIIDFNKELYCLLVDNQDVYKVLLPQWIWERAKNKEHFLKFVLQYMRRYPHYSVKSVKGRFAICIRK